MHEADFKYSKSCSAVSVQIRCSQLQVEALSRYVSVVLCACVCVASCMLHTKEFEESNVALLAVGSHSGSKRLGVIDKCCLLRVCVFVCALVHAHQTPEACIFL